MSHIYIYTHIFDIGPSFPTPQLAAEFGEKAEEACKIKFHSLQPHMESCKATAGGF